MTPIKHTPSLHSCNSLPNTTLQLSYLQPIYDGHTPKFRTIEGNTSLSIPKQPYKSEVTNQQRSLNWGFSEFKASKLAIHTKVPIFDFDRFTDEKVPLWEGF